ncbi:MAG: hypothetical protein UX97_C0019G0008 [Candidatus Beckwithbacteria bacterium GW2011_GWA2_47_25]|nr:MAG: hypothetical protein UX97_C0019G0008 [Candidatus Beckwithbacteria bacterium GW2011_GWA2_47_25]
MKLKAIGAVTFVQEVALVEDHVRVEAVPDVIEVGLAVREMVGAGLVVPPVYSYAPMS